MLDTWEQRVRREGITLTKISFPVPPPSLADLAQRFEQAITPRTRVIHFCHITNLTARSSSARHLPDGRDRGIATIIDGAHAFAHFPFKVSELECDYYGTACTSAAGADRHRIPLCAPRQDRDLWPLTPASESKRNDIRKFEEIGTHPPPTTTPSPKP